jgi:hypothetical protein
MFKLQALVAAVLPLVLAFATTATEAKPGVVLAKSLIVEADTMTVRPGVA